MSEMINKKITDGHYDQSLAVKCINGTFVGKKSERVITYKGIPFVDKQPVGDLRWKAPVEYTPNDGIYEAYNFAKLSCQDLSITDHQGEDCLYLNVYKADEAGTKKPVMVWIHGGAFMAGGTGLDLFDCTALVKENPDVIYVTVAYRLGALGFLHLSHLADGKDYPDAQNLGLLDQKMALKWVHENIAAFGGDPDNVTIWGESAGAGSVTMQPLIKGSQQYFQKVIAQSGAPIQTNSVEESISTTNDLMEALGCKTVADLMKVDARMVIDTAAATVALRMFPVRDGRILPLDPWKEYENGIAKDIVFLQGCNKDEMNTFLGVVGVDVWNAWADSRLEEKRAQLTDAEKVLVQRYMDAIPGERHEATVRLFSQIMFIAPQIRLSEAQTQAGGQSYTYYYTVESALPLIKSGHASELSVVFNHPEFQDFTGRAYDEAFCRAMRKLWVQFARTGTPSPEWPLYNLEDKPVMVLDEKDIHPATESELNIVDWEKSYFLTNYYMP